uniref:DUF5681 domain-containing protein n=1 Tax=Altererythrobacter segetis TaxID=1104773 RepID=UPI00140D0A63|nr:DUF5681 domain-containing protein [Altererythrobacter segetis]
MANRYSDRPYKVGKGKPPFETQFGNGRRGNTNGRPAGSRNTDTVVAKALAARLPVKENGRDRKLSKMEVVVMQLVNKAAGGDLRAIEIVLRMAREIDGKAQPHEQPRPLSDADRAVLEAFAKKVREGGGQP